MNNLINLLKNMTTTENKPLFFWNNHIIETHTFINDVSKLAAYIKGTKYQRLAINSDDVYEIAVSVFAILLCQGEPILLPNGQTGTLAQLNPYYDHLLESPLQLCEKIEPICISYELSDVQSISFFTSGSNGEPKKVTRSLYHLTQELITLNDTFSFLSEDAHVYSTVSARHIYGFLFYLLWPLCANRCIYRNRLKTLYTLTSAKSPVILISSPAILKRIIEPMKMPEQLSIFSSGGLLRKTESDQVKTLLNNYPIEILGSTETGAVATRQQAHGDLDKHWLPLAPISISLAEDCLQIRSPFFAEDVQVMQDNAILHADGSFQLLGRSDRIIKIEENRVSLTDIENQLHTHPYVKESVALVLDKHRLIIAVVIHLSADGKSKLTQNGKSYLDTMFKQALLNHYPNSLLPKRFRYVDDMPVNSQGKYILAELQQLFEEP